MIADWTVLYVVNPDQLNGENSLDINAFAQDLHGFLDSATHNVKINFLMQVIQDFKQESLQHQAKYFEIPLHERSSPIITRDVYYDVSEPSEDILRGFLRSAEPFPAKNYAIVFVAHGQPPFQIRLLRVNQAIAELDAGSPDRQVDVDDFFGKHGLRWMRKHSGESAASEQNGGTEEAGAALLQKAVDAKKLLLSQSAILSDLLNRFPSGITNVDAALTVRNIQNALEWNATRQNGFRIRTAIFDSCGMATVESAYALRNSCDSMIASTILTLSAGNIGAHRAVLEQLVRSDAVTDSQLLENLTEAVTKDGLLIPGRRSFVGVGLQDMDALAQHVDTLGRSLLAWNRESCSAWRRVIDEKLQDLGGWTYQLTDDAFRTIGFREFCNHLRLDPATPNDVKVACKACSEDISQRVFDEYSKLNAGPHIYFPVRKSNFTLLPNSYRNSASPTHQIQFCADTSWDEFLVRYLDPNPCSTG